MGLAAVRATEEETGHPAHNTVQMGSDVSVCVCIHKLTMFPLAWCKYERIHFQIPVYVCVCVRTSVCVRVHQCVGAL